MRFNADTFRSLWGAFKRQVKRRLNKSGPFLADALERDKRLDICKACPQMEANGQCRVCTCFVSLKTMIRDEYCPKNYW